MDSVKDTLFNRNCQKTVQLKFNSKQLEARLLCAIQAKQTDNHTLLLTLNDLISCYQSLYPDAPTSFPTSQRPPSGSLKEYGDALQKYSLELHRQYESKKQKKLLQHLWICLGNLHYCIHHHAFQKVQISNDTSSTLFHEQKSDATNWFCWLGDLISTHRALSGWSNQFCNSLSNSELKQLARSFNSKDYAAIINSVFYFKFHPEELLTDQYTPASLLQCKHQLNDLHDQILLLFQTLANHCLERCHITLANYLYYGSELPEGVSFMTQKNHAEVIAAVLKNYPLDFNIDAPRIAQNPAQDFLRAYKFWFNPARLIDAIMGLWTSSSVPGNTAKEHFAQFTKSAQQYYQKISTSECIDLYGYFINKDSEYLLRCLQTAASDAEWHSLPNRSLQDKKIIDWVAQLLIAVIQALQTELGVRNIKTNNAPNLMQKDTPFQPGKRNLQAINHIIECYSTIEHKENSMLENLLNVMEDQD